MLLFSLNFIAVSAPHFACVHHADKLRNGSLHHSVVVLTELLGLSMRLTFILGLFFTPALSLGKLGSISARGGLETSHGFQQPLVPLLSH